MSGGDQTRSAVHQFLNHCFQAATLGGVTDGADRASQANQADPTQHVIANGRQAHDQVVGIEFSGWQALKIQIGFEFAMKLRAIGFKLSL